jgi:hypothetical protein
LKSKEPRIIAVIATELLRRLAGSHPRVLTNFKAVNRHRLILFVRLTGRTRAAGPARGRSDSRRCRPHCSRSRWCFATSLFGAAAADMFPAALVTLSHIRYIASITAPYALLTGFHFIESLG